MRPKGTPAVITPLSISLRAITTGFTVRRGAEQNGGDTCRGIFFPSIPPGFDASTIYSP